MFADHFESFESGKHLLSQVFTTGRLCEAAVSQITQRTHSFLHFSESFLVLCFNLGNLCLETLACVFDAGVDCLQCVGVLATVAGELTLLLANA